ncbi:LOW QUALITY PROTEIN: hypothetical protein PHMEG_00011366 [Phytophthora megakarya]|uniref:Cleavage induced protein n=1 Tax=Phytophthora megakarya TaxID=4795 RepID=A0A225WCT7_9STRA|nr:LOW QUALITY PROTEIN: hypothetical protein PHMEG_00011366 [Phytophthora megakarya]
MRPISLLISDIRYATLKKCMAKYGIDLPASKFPTSRENGGDREYLLNAPMRHALSELVRRSGASLPAFVKMNLCNGYKRLNELLTIAQEDFEVRLRKKPPRQQLRPSNHGSAKERLNVLRKNIRKEQDAWRCLVLDSDLLKHPFGVADKRGEDASVSGRTIHDLSYPEDDSINDYTDPTSIIKPGYHHCDAVASEILRAKREHPEIEVEIMAGDVVSAFRNINIHSNSVHSFVGRIEDEIASLLSCPRRLDGQVPWFLRNFSLVQGCHYNDANPTGFFNYHWVDDHINVAANVGTTLNDMDLSLRFAMETILGVEEVNDEKFTPCNTSSVLNLTRQRS